MLVSFGLTVEVNEQAWFDKHLCVPNLPAAKLPWGVRARLLIAVMGAPAVEDGTLTIIPESIIFRSIMKDASDG